MRQLVVNEALFLYKVGRGFTLIVAPDGKRKVIANHSMVGVTHPLKVGDYSITPKMVADWIEGNIYTRQVKQDSQVAAREHLFCKSLIP